MDTIREIIDTLTIAEKKEFQRFIQRNRFKTERVDLDLFNLLSSDIVLSSDELLIALYGEGGDRNAYHSVRKRLVKHLNDFIYLKMIDNDESLAAEIGKSLILVRHLFENNLYKLGWKYLKKAEKLATNAELNLQLQLIYDLQIEHYDKEQLVLSLKELVEKRRQIAELATEDQNLSIIGSFVRQELNKVKMGGEDLDLEKILDLLLNTFNMKDSLFRRPKLRYNFVQIARQIILANKEFFAFEDYIIDNYTKIEKSGYLDGRPSNRLTMLYMIAHTLYRNKKFSEAIGYLDEMNHYMNNTTKSVFNRFNVKCAMLWAACENFNGNLERSIDILKDITTFQYIQKEDGLNAQLNLSVYYFQKQDYKAANRTLIDMGHTDKWFEKNMGIEWKIKKNLIEVIYQYELENTEIAIDRINGIERSNKEILISDKYSRIAVFLGLVKQIIKNPTIVQTEEFHNKVEASFVWVNREEEDLQAMSYYAWLKSKMTKSDFYSVLRTLLFS